MLLLPLIWGGLSSACDHKSYKSQVKWSCDDDSQSCVASLSESASRTERWQRLCSGATDEPCTSFVTCIQTQLAKHGCSDDPQLNEGLQSWRSDCAKTETVSQTCLTKINDECIHTPTFSPTKPLTGSPFSWTECGNHSHTQPPTPQPTGFPYSVPPGVSTLPSSTAGRVLILKRIRSSDCSIQTVARSYDGHPWETTMAHPINHLNCTQQSCAITVPFGAGICDEVRSTCAYRVDAVDLHSDDMLTPEQTIARLMQQATFGASRPALDDFFNKHELSKTGPVTATSMQGKIAEWVREQMAVPHTSLRKYYRQRVSNRQVNSVSQAGRRSTPCEIGSRWHRYAFTSRDRFQRIDVSQEHEGTYSLRINGVLRTEIPIAAWKGWTGNEGEAAIEENVFTLPFGRPTAAPSASPTASPTTASTNATARARELSEGGPFTAKQCPAGSCCVVIYKGAAGAQCNPVPVWDLKDWMHPGGSFVTASALCGSVRYSWLGKSGSHASADPEDATLTSLSGGGVKVGTYTDPACATPSPTTATTPSPTTAPTPSLTTATITPSPTTTPTNAPTAPSLIVLCQVSEDLYDASLNQVQAIEVSKSGTCVGNDKDLFWFANPPINFTSLDPATTHDFGADDATFRSLDGVRKVAGSQPFPVPTVMLLQTLASASVCANSSVEEAFPFLHRNGYFYKFDPRLVLVENTLTHPADTGDSARVMTTAVNANGACAAVAKTFLNEASCVRRQSCASPLFSSVPVTLNASTLLLWHQLSGTHVHYIDGLRLEDEYAVSPCAGPSRWRKVEGATGTGTGTGTDTGMGGGCPSEGAFAATALDNATMATLAAVLSASAATDPNPFVRDIVEPVEHPAAPANATCHASLAGVSSIGARVSVGAECWEHVHPHTYDVMDFTTWTLDHDGNANAYKAGRPNPIIAFADRGRAGLVFPSHHPMSRWAVKTQTTTKGLAGTALGGRLGDTIAFSSLPTSVQTLEMAEHFGALGNKPDDAMEACGSPGEAANVGIFGHQFHMQMHPEEQLYRFQELDHPHGSTSAKGAVWTNVALKAPDQLRQRMAWALSQILVTSVSGLNRHDEVEPWAVYHDIFVRHAFGNFRDVLREVSYNGVMAEYLTFRANKAIAFAGTYPDENYARESMQLFSIGLWKVHDDGTPVVDEKTGEAGVTYDNDDVATFARVWTGFERQPPRGNVHLPQGFQTFNVLDPSMLKPSWRDRFPKAKLDAGYLGDGYALCTDLPERYFLSKGAVYKQVPGGASAEGRIFDAFSNLKDNGGFLGRFVPSAANSSLYKSLCAADAAGNCTFPLEVVLDRALPCHGQECTAERLRSVKVVDAKSGAVQWYESVRPTCVGLTFAADSKYTKWVTGPTTAREEWHQCADAGAAIATASCCNHVGVVQKTYEDANGDSDTVTGAPCNFAAEQMTYVSAEARCKAIGSQVCEDSYIEFTGQKFRSSCGQGYFSWLNKPCQVQIQVQSNGWVNIVEPHAAGVGEAGKSSTRNEAVFAPDSLNVFRVYWDFDLFPTHANGCQGAGGAGAAGCMRANGGTCLCNITVVEAAAFTDTAHVPSRAELEAALFIGSIPPEGFDTIGGEGYSKCTADVCAEAGAAGVHVYNRGPPSAAGSLTLGADTIFELPAALAGGKKRFLRNRASSVRVPHSGFSFRNPPHFMPLLGEMFNHYSSQGEDQHVGAAAQEVEALIDHLFEHDNTAPFVAHKLIQRLVSANPSPRYVKAVAAAFRSGSYPGAGRSFSGRYGDLGAAMAAVLLDREARSATLDADPSFGKLREPLLKVLHVFRAMEYRAGSGREVQLPNMIDDVGMAPFESPTVFNFYLPDYQPDGPIAAAGLVSPETQLSTTPLVVAYLNGMQSLIDWGLTSCAFGFGEFKARPARQCSTAERKSGLTRATSDGVLEFSLPNSTTPAAIVDELDVLLTSGRLSRTSKDVIIKAYEEELSATTTGFCSPASAKCSKKASNSWCNLNRDNCFRCGMWCPTGPGDAAAALRVAQKLMVAAPEFHTTALNNDARTQRPVPKVQKSLGRGFKAIVVIFLHGGADSWSLLTPHSGCNTTAFGGDLFDEYTAIRTNVALKKTGSDSLLQIDAGDSAIAQPCSTFGQHPSLGFLKRAYDDGDAAWVANVGALVEATSPQQFADKSVRLPPSIGAHNIQQRCLQSVHAQYSAAKGVLGRAQAAITSEGNAQPPYKSASFSLAGNVKFFEGGSPPYMIDGKVGVVRYQDYAKLGGALANLTKPVSTSLHAETYAQSLEASLSSSEALGGMLDNVVIANGDAFDSTETENFNRGDNQRLALQFKQVSKVLKLRGDLDLERAGFVVNLGGFDTHTDEGGVVKMKMETLDATLEVFAAELKQQGLWDNITILTVSDFGRTLSSNGAGTDHAWGGNHFIMGGGIKGGRIFGQFPSSLSMDSDLIINKRGSVLPTTSWEGMWEGVLQWFGVEEKHMPIVLPNLAKFAKKWRIDAQKLYESVV